MKWAIRSRFPVAVVLMAFLILVGALLGSIVTSLCGPKWLAPVWRRSVTLLRDGTYLFSEYGMDGRRRWYDAEMNEIPSSSPTLKDIGRRTAWMIDFWHLGDRPEQAHYRRKWGWGNVPTQRPGETAVWYFLPHRGRFEEYNLETRRLVGTLGPDGYREGSRLSGPRFDAANRRWAGQAHLGLAANKVFLVDPSARKVAELFEIASPEDTEVAILRARRTPEAQDEGIPVLPGFVLGEEAYASAPSYYVLLRRGRLTLLSPNREKVFEARVPRTQRGTLTIGLGDGGTILVVQSLPGDAVWHRHYIMVFGPDGSVLKSSYVRARLADPVRPRGLRDDWPVMLAPPAVMIASLWYALVQRPDTLTSSDFDTIPPLFAFSLVFGVLSAAVLWLLAFRAGSRVAARVSWAVFGLGFSVLGVFTYLGLREPSHREPCPSCGRMRPVHVPTCPACAAPFPAPKRTGIEVLDSQAA